RSYLGSCCYHSRSDGVIVCAILRSFLQSLLLRRSSAMIPYRIPSVRVIACLCLITLLIIPLSISPTTPVSASAILSRPQPSQANTHRQSRAVSSASPGIISIWGGARESIALKSDGTVWAWGLNDCSILGTGPCSKLGDGTAIQRNVPTQTHG